MKTQNVRVDESEEKQNAKAQKVRFGVCFCKGTGNYFMVISS